MADKNEKTTVSSKLNTFMEKNRVFFLSLLIVVIVALIGIVVFEVVKTKITGNDLAVIDTISYELTKDSSGLSEEELAKRSEDTLASLAKYESKSGIVGIRANLLAGELAFAKKDYESAVDYWTKAVNKGKKSYTAPIASYNLGVCYEELGKKDEAAAAYKSAYEAKDYMFAYHAKFSYARVLESMAKFDEAAAVYKEMIDEKPYDSWSNLAKTRVISLESEGKIQK